MSKAIGIDLGTTFSSVAYLENGKAFVIPDREGRKTTPSLVTFTEDGVFVGWEAAKNELKYPDSTIRQIKRKMGTSEKIKINEKLFSPEEISAFILKHIKKQAEDFLGEKVKEAVITVPAYFNDNQRQATKIAGELAGLEVLRIINEPTAAALAYDINGKEESKVVVYDLGGGTFDVSVLCISDGVFEVVSTCGDNKLGGEDFNKRLMDVIKQKFFDETKIDIATDPLAMLKLSEEVEKAKIALSSMEKTRIYIPFITADKDGPKNLDFEITRKEFEALITDYIEKTIELCREALNDAALDVSEIDRIILVGGSSKIPLVREKVKDFFKKDPQTSIDPKEVVAKGAAIQAGIIQGEKSGIVLVDLIPLSLGIEVENGYFVPIIERNSPIPISAKRIFTTVMDYQKAVDINIYQGESMYAKNNIHLGNFRLEGIREAKKGEPRIEVTFEIDVNGILNVSAMDLDTRNLQKITIQNKSILSKDEIEAIQKEHVIKYSEEISKRKNLYEVMRLKTYSENLIDKIKSALPPAHYGMLVEEELDELSRQIKKYEEELNSEELKKQIERLEFIYNEINFNSQYREVV
jgi:molecular chaperone DnaK